MPCHFNGRGKQTFRNIERTGKLLATVLTTDLLPFVECCNKYTAQEVAALDFLICAHNLVPTCYKAKNLRGGNIIL
jgi:hypothetical protein